MARQRLTFTVYGPVVAWHRPDDRRLGGRRKHDLDAFYQDVIAMVAVDALEAWQKKHRRAWNLEGEFVLNVDAYVQDRRRRDSDNIKKNVMDGLIGFVYDDDDQVVDDRTVRRLDRAKPRIEVEVRTTSGHMDG